MVMVRAAWDVSSKNRCAPDQAATPAASVSAGPPYELATDWVAPVIVAGVIALVATILLLRIGDPIGVATEPRPRSDRARNVLQKAIHAAARQTRIAKPMRYDRKLWIVEPVTPAAYPPA